MAEYAHSTERNDHLERPEKPSGLPGIISDMEDEVRRVLRSRLGSCSCRGDIE